MRFAPANGPEFFRPQGWQLDEFHSMMEEAQRLKREMSFAWLWRAIGRLYPARLQEEFRRMSGLVKLARV
jgi:hypothetical protein